MIDTENDNVLDYINELGVESVDDLSELTPRELISLAKLLKVVQARRFCRFVGIDVNQLDV